MFNIIIKNFLTSIDSTMNNINKDIENKNLKFNFLHTLFNFDNIDKFNYLVLIIFILIFISQINIGINKFITIIISFFIFYVFIYSRHTEIKKYDKKYLTKLEYLKNILSNNKRYYDNFSFTNKSNYEHLESNPLVVSFYFDNKDYYNLNQTCYVLSLIYSINIIAIHKDFERGLKNKKQNLSMIKIYYKNALNEYESLIHSFNETNANSNNGKKFNNSVKLLQKILLGMIEDCEKRSIESNLLNGYNINMEPDDMINNNIVEANDTESLDYNPSFNYY